MSDQKDAKHLKRREFLRLAALGGAGAVAAACAAPTPQVIEKVVTQVVEKPVEKIVEKPVEKIVEKVSREGRHSAHRSPRPRRWLTCAS